MGAARASRGLPIGIQLLNMCDDSDKLFYFPEKFTVGRMRIGTDSRSIPSVVIRITVTFLIFPSSSLLLHPVSRAPEHPQTWFPHPSLPNAYPCHPAPPSPHPIVSSPPPFSTNLHPIRKPRYNRDSPSKFHRPPPLLPYPTSTRLHPPLLRSPGLNSRLPPRFRRHTRAPRLWGPRP